MKPHELESLISLLDDPDEIIYSQVKTKIISLGQDVIPVLESAWEHNSFGVLFQSRVEEIIHSIQFDNIYDAINRWGRENSGNLLEGIILVAKYQYPDLDTQKIYKYMDQLQQDVWIELNNNLTALEQVKIINHILFDVHGFSGNTTNYHAPQNSYMNNVLETKRGNPISLSILYTIIGQRLGIPIYGINLPNHFVLAYVDRMSVAAGLPLDESKILFYVNPFSRGGVFSKKEIDYFLKQLKVEPNPNFFVPCSNVTIMRRVFNNLINSYEKLGYPDKVEEIRNLSIALSPENLEEGKEDDL